jgi:hypothetical protein
MKHRKGRGGRVIVLISLKRDIHGYNKVPSKYT